jgi:cold shock CspA family protein/ribosome-associated translation inhibitor RaiA
MVEIHWRNFNRLDSDVREAIEGRLRALAAERDDLIDVRIAGQRSEHHRHGGCEARIAANLRGKEIVAMRSGLEDRVALDEALDAFEREVRKRRELRDDPRAGSEPTPPLGIVDRVFRTEGYGFVITDGGERVYFHRNAVHPPLRFDALEEGHRVALNWEAGEKGLQATTLNAPPPDAPAP